MFLPYRYHEAVGGVLLAYARIRFAEGAASAGYELSGDAGLPLGRFLEENPALHVRATADVLLFRPAIGDVLVGRVHAIGSGHISLLVAGVFNATLHADELAPWYAPSEDAWDATPRLDQEVADDAAAPIANAGAMSGRKRRADSRDASDIKELGEAQASLLASNPRHISEGSHVSFRVKGIIISSGILTLDGALQKDSAAGVEGSGASRPSAPAQAGSKAAAATAAEREPTPSSTMVGTKRKEKGRKSRGATES